MIKYAFDHGITHFDLANNYGPVPGSAEANFGRILKENFHGYRDEMIISSKAGHDMWAGPYGGNSSRKNLMASIDQSLRRTGLEYFDIFYSHRYDGVTPVEETIQTLIDIVRQGKALYIGISKYPPQQARFAYEMMAKAGVPCLISQYRYSMFDRAVEAENLPLAAEYGSGFIAFSPLAQGLLTDRYLNGVPEGSRAARSSTFLQRSQVTPEKVEVARQLNEIARRRGQTLAEMALGWVLRDERMTSVIVGASSVNQLADNLQALNHLEFTAEELNEVNVVALFGLNAGKAHDAGRVSLTADHQLSRTIGVGDVGQPQIRGGHGQSEHKAHCHDAERQHTGCDRTSAVRQCFLKFDGSDTRQLLSFHHFGMRRVLPLPAKRRAFFPAKGRLFIRRFTS